MQCALKAVGENLDWVQSPKEDVWAWVATKGIAKEYGYPDAKNLWFFMYGHKINLARALKDIFTKSMYPPQETQKYAVKETNQQIRDIVTSERETLILIDVNTKEVIDKWQYQTQQVVNQQGEITDAYVYTHEMILQNLVLLEDHFKAFPCPDCIQKHIQSLRGYLREAIDLAPQEHKEFWISLKDEFYNWSSDPGTDDLSQWSMKIREFRKRVMHDIELEQLQQETEPHVVLEAIANVDANGDDSDETDDQDQDQLNCIPCALGALGALGVAAAGSSNKCPEGFDVTDGYCAQRVKDPDYFDPDSIRNVYPECKDWAEEHGVPLEKAEEQCPKEIKNKSHIIKVGCPKGKYDKENDRCEVGMETQSVWHRQEEVQREWEKHKGKVEK